MDRQEIIIYKTKDGKSSEALYARDGDIFLNQNQLAELFTTSKQNIGQHIENILEDKELDRDSVVKNYFTTAADGKEECFCKLSHKAKRWITISIFAGSRMQMWKAMMRPYAALAQAGRACEEG